MICFYIFWILILELKCWYKAIWKRFKVLVAMATESENFMTIWWQTTHFFWKMHWFEEVILLYQSSLECKNFVKSKETQLFYFVRLVDHQKRDTFPLNFPKGKRVDPRNLPQVLACLLKLGLKTVLCNSVEPNIKHWARCTFIQYARKLTFNTDVKKL